MKSLSTNMAQGQMQLTMEETGARNGRDEWTIRLHINNLTEDAEMEKFLSAIPSSFNTEEGGRRDTTRVRTKARVLLRDHTGIQQLTNLHPLGASTVSLDQ